MLSYQHAYHAGNHADVLKHWVLLCCLEWLNRKPGGWTYYDTHAGEGLYDLEGEMASRGREWPQGIGRLMAAESLPASVQRYVAAIRRVNSDGQLRYYPGSPLIAQGCLRPQDALVCCELHPQAFPVLKDALRSSRNVALHARDGFEGVGALLPPATGRGLVLIDPSYELKEDYHRIPSWLAVALKRWRQMTALVWYPLLADRRHDVLIKGISQVVMQPEQTVNWVTAECRLKTMPPAGLQGSGMLVINPPWGLEQALDSDFSALSAVLGAEAEVNRSPC